MPEFIQFIQEAERRRIININYPCTFKPNIERDDPENHIYKSDPYLKSEEFKDKYKFAEMKYLLEIFNDTKGKIYLSEDTITNTTNFFNNSNWFATYFEENYEFIEENKIYTQISAIFDEAKNSSNFKYLSKIEQKEFSIKYIINFITSHSEYSKYYKERINIKNIVGNRTTARKIIYNCVKRDNII